MGNRAQEILSKLASLADDNATEGMARYGINVDKAYGIRVPTLRKIAKEIGVDHQLAGELWTSGIHEARVLASMIGDPAQVTEAQMERWAADFNSWDLCDQCCSNLFDKTSFAYDKAMEWSGREEEYVKRAGFALMAALAVHDKKAPNSRFEQFFPYIVREATDARNFVKKAVNWALRNIGKRNLSLNAKAIEVAGEIAGINDKTARWNARDALRELNSEKIMERLKNKAES
jgi:3-methyladenine DNA glycosylase AlkD